MVESLVFHGGDPKTGSTAVQNIVRNGLFEAGSTRIFMQKENTINSFRKMIMRKHRKNFEHIINMWRKTIRVYNRSDADIGVLSGEGLSGTDLALLRQIIETQFDVPFVNVKIVCYLRTHKEALLSRYAQKIKSGQFTDDIDAYYDIAHERLVYADRMGRW